MSVLYVPDAEKLKVSLVYDTAATPKVRHTGSVQSITRSSTTATAIAPAHGLQNSSSVDIAGADQTDYNVTATITVVDADTFTFTVSNSPVTPATGNLSVSDTNQSVHMNGPAVLQVDSIAGSTTVKVEACVRRSLGWVQIGSDLTSSDNGKLVTVTPRYNFVRCRRSTGTGAVKIYSQG